MVFNILFYIGFCISVYAFTEVNCQYLGFPVIFILIVMVAFPFLAVTTDWGWFLYIKCIFTLATTFSHACVNYFSDAIYRPLQRSAKIVAYLRPYMVVVHILIAGLLDYQLGHFFNVVIGVLVCITIPRFWDGWTFNKDKILGFDNKRWVIFYLLWNANLCYLAIETIDPNFCIPTLLILLVSIIYCMVKQDWHLWMTARAYTLCLFIVMYTFLPNLFPHPSLSPIANIEILINVLSTFMGSYLIYDYIKHKRSCLVYCPSKSLTYS